MDVPSVQTGGLSYLCPAMLAINNTYTNGTTRQKSQHTTVKRSSSRLEDRQADDAQSGGSRGHPDAAFCPAHCKYVLFAVLTIFLYSARPRGSGAPTPKGVPCSACTHAPNRYINLVKPNNYNIWPHSSATQLPRASAQRHRARTQRQTKRLWVRDSRNEASSMGRAQTRSFFGSCPFTVISLATARGV